MERHTDDSITFGGISGLFFEGSSWLALSDGRGAQGPPRVYRLEIGIGDEELDVHIVERIRLSGIPEPGRFDPEGITKANGRLLIAAEGDGVTPRLPPSMFSFDDAWRRERSFALPARFSPPEQGLLSAGTRPNRGLEGLAVLEDGSIVAAMESSLVQDGPPSHSARGASVRFVRFGADLEYSGEIHYRTDPLPAGVSKAGPPLEGEVGVSALAALGGQRVLVLERATVQEPGRFRNHIRIYLIDLSQAEDVRDHDSLEGTPPTEKQLVIDLASIASVLDPPLLDNFEAMAVGPPIDPGGRLLLLASDDNFASSQRTAFVAFAITE